MGHGLVTHRSQIYFSNAVKNQLEGEFLKGVANSGNEKDVLEMVETCFIKLPVPMVPSIQAVSNWLAESFSYHFV
jgi:pyruvate/oxaloacetate carboxyltransferase